eukprot:1461545-Pleurochrysis_carterae.AAC.2
MSLSELQGRLLNLPALAQFDENSFYADLSQFCTHEPWHCCNLTKNITQALRIAKVAAVF